ncbi:uncharacterized conserved protein [Hahella chejuensis KCTC 2396]|uniref:Uncharacterized conserved protein n=1 Tax=Hahella chejuensis (strain KCTC 2396) TaxID=349521 RepID=Q2SKK5_HAHCH|nr:YbjQ family protein [Hahella chejuensis]ABC28819.1 uncharacterized conserved protein [Hahella chejuensis KCTC 2396]
MEMFINIGAFLLLMALGYGFGRRAEKAHFKSLRIREAKHRAVILSMGRHIPEARANVEARLVTGSVVVSVDYFKRFFATLRLLIGGRLFSYESLLERARREAILRMKEQAVSLGSKEIYNVKLETSTISSGMQSALGTVEVLAYGTAVVDK